MAKKKAHGLTCRPVGFINGARPYVFGLERLYEVAELGVGGVARVGECLHGGLSTELGGEGAAG